MRPRKLLLAAAGMAAMAGAAPPVLVRPSLPAPPVDMQATLRTAVERAQGGDCPGALALLDPALPATPGPDRAAVQMLRLPCLAATNRRDDAVAAQAELAKVAPANPLVRSLGVMLAADAGRFADAARGLETMATNAPESLRLVSGAAWRAIAQKLTEQKEAPLRDRVSIALARADWQPADRPEMRDGVAQDAVRALLVQGQASEAGLLVDRIDTPELLAGMATERAYAPVWPAIEARMGDRQAIAVDRFAARKLDDFARADDARARRDAVRAFVLLGRLDDAAEIAAPVQVVDGMSDDDVTSVRYHAQALAASGRRNAAIARLRPFATLDPVRTPAAMSAIVSLAEALDEAGREEEALSVAAAGLARGSGALSPWGTAWLRRTEVCALSALGRPEARAKGDALLAAATDNEAATIEAMLCASRTGDAAALAVKTLATADGAARLIDQFQPSGSFWASSPSRLRALWTPLLARRDVHAAFERAGRILPQRYWPAAAPRAIPRAGPADASTI